MMIVGDDRLHDASGIRNIRSGAATVVVQPISRRFCPNVPTRRRPDRAGMRSRRRGHAVVQQGDIERKIARSRHLPTRHRSDKAMVAGSEPRRHRAAGLPEECSAKGGGHTPRTVLTLMVVFMLSTDDSKTRYFNKANYATVQVRDQLKHARWYRRYQDVRLRARLLDAAGAP